MRVLPFAAALLAFASLTCAQALPPDTRFIMSHFKATAAGGDERLYISISPDGLNWTALNNNHPVWKPPNPHRLYNVVRDPSLVHVNGFYWVAYTSGNIGAQASFGLVKSADLLNWTFVGNISTVVSGGADQLTWGPYFFQDGDGAVHLFVAINPTGGSHFEVVPGLRCHEMHPLNADFTQWSTPVPLNLPGTNTNEFWAWKEGTTYHAIYVDFAQNGAYIHVTSTDLLGTWGNPKRIGFDSQEGGFVLRRPEGGYRLYLEPGNALPLTGYRTCDLDENFNTLTPQVEINHTVTMRNGKVIAAPGPSNFSAWQTAKLSTVPLAARAPTADPEGDGLSNLVECALGTEPLAPTVRRPEVFTRQIGAETFAGLRFTRLRQCADVTLSVESSDAPGAWIAGPITESVTLMSDGTEWLHTRDALSATLAPTCFLRLKATLTPAPAPPPVPQAASPVRQQAAAAKASHTRKRAR